jgi:putative ABC transport system substrate-binding protein
MRRRDFITLLGGAAAGWPLAAGAQQGERLRRIGVLPQFSEADLLNLPDLPVFREALAKLGWAEDRNLRIDVRFAGADAERIQALATELVALAPDVLVAAGGVATRELQRQTKTIPIVFTGAGDPNANGLVGNIARPEGNVTGITNLFASIGGKWLELLKRAFPTVERAGVLYDPRLATGADSVYISSAEEAARALAIQAVRLPYRDAVDIVRGIEGFAAEAHGALLVLPPSPNPADRAAIRRLAGEHRLPTLWPARQYAAEGGLLAYGSNELDRWRRAASFVNRVLRGAKVSELPVEFPSRFDLTINLKVAKALGLTISESLVLIADEVIE